MCSVFFFLKININVCFYVRIYLLFFSILFDFLVIYIGLFEVYFRIGCIGILFFEIRIYVGWFYGDVYFNIRVYFMILGCFDDIRKFIWGLMLFVWCLFLRWLVY